MPAQGPIIAQGSARGKAGGANPCSRSVGNASTKAATTPTRLTAYDETPRTSAFAARTRPRRGVAAKVVRIKPRRYSEVANRTPTQISAMSPAMTPMSPPSTMSSSGGFGPTLPVPVTAKPLPDAAYSPPRGAPSFSPGSRLGGGPTRSPLHDDAPLRTTLSNVAEALVGRSPTLELPPPRDI